MFLVLTSVIFSKSRFFIRVTLIFDKAVSKSGVVSINFRTCSDSRHDETCGGWVLKWGMPLKYLVYNGLFYNG